MESSFSREFKPPLKRGDGDSTQHRVYPIRFIVCIVIGMNNIFNAMIWITFAPVQARTAEFSIYVPNHVVTRSVLNILAQSIF